MPDRMMFTERRIKDLSPAPSSVDSMIYDEEVRELAIRTRIDCLPHWYLQKWAHGKQHRIALGTWPGVPVELARELAREQLVLLARGGDPIAAKRAVAAKVKGGRVPFADVLKRHLSILKERGRTGPHVAELKRVVELAIAAGLKDLAFPGVATKAANWLDKLDVSDQTRHRYRVHLIAVGKTAVRWYPADVLPREPFLALGGKGAPMPAPAVFDPAECCLLASDAALGREEVGGRLWAFLLLTGLRFKEATWARWDRIDLDRATFGVIPPDAAEHAAGARVKRDKARTVTLQAELVELLRTWKKGKDGFLFPGIWRTRPHVYNTFAFRSHLKALGIPLAARRPHSLRHSHACLAIACGEDSMRLRLSMGHAGPEMQGHYASQAMRWRGLLAGWSGSFRLRDPVEIIRISGERGANLEVG